MKKFYLVVILVIAGTAVFLLSRPSDISQTLSDGDSISIPSNSGTNYQYETRLETSPEMSTSVARENTDGEISDSNHSQDTNNGFSNVSFDSFLEEDGNSRKLVTSAFEEQTTESIRTLTSNLGFDDNKHNLAFETEYKLERKLGEFPSMQNDTTRCSSSIYASLFTRQDRQSVIQTLDNLSRDEEINSISGGGYMRHIVENGIHYGMIVVVFKDEVPLTIR